MTPARPLPLARLQRWMQSVVVHPGPLSAALRARAARDVVPAVGEVIRPSRTLSAGDRVGIYHGMYLLRMEEALETDYPGLRRFLGADTFRALVRDYVQRHPSRSYTLNRLGDHLPAFVGRTRIPHRAFAVDLARLELALTRVFDAEETAPLIAEAAAALPPEVWERTRLRPIAAFELLALRHDVGAWLDAKDGPRRPRPVRRDAWVAVYRRDYAVYRLDLSRAAHALLADLAAGEPLGRAVARAMARRARPRPDADVLFRWFREWVARGLFAQVRPRRRAR